MMRAGRRRDTAIDEPLGRDEHGQRVLREHLASIYFTYDATCLVRAGFVIVLGVFMHLQTPHPLVWPFVALHLLLYLFLYFAPKWSPSVPAGETALWVRRITGTVVLLGFADALAPWLFVPAGNLPATSVLMVVMMGNCARAVQSLRPLKTALIGYTLPMMGGLIIALAIQGDGMHLFLATFAVIYLLMMLRVGVQEHKRLTESLTLRFEKEQLAARLREQAAATAPQQRARLLALQRVRVVEGRFSNIDRQERSMNPIDPILFLAALDKAHTSAEGSRLLAALGISEADLRKNPMEEVGHRMYEDDARGTLLDFVDESKLSKTPIHDIGEGPWVMFQFYFMSGAVGGGRYTGALPYGITFDMTRADLAEWLGSPTSSNPMVELWQKEGHRVSVNFDRKSGAIKAVGVQARLE